MSANHWVCQTCKKPIGSSLGIIEIVNADPELGIVGSYPKDPTPVERTGDLKRDTMAHMARGRRLQFRVYHQPECAPDSDEEGYWFTVERASKLEDWVAWAIHLSEKTWFDDVDMVNFLRFWWSHKGEQVSMP